MREASVTMVEKVAETGEESSSPSVTTSTNSVLTVTVLVLLAIVFPEDAYVGKAVICLKRKGWF